MKKINLYSAIALATTVSTISLSAANSASSSDVFSGGHILGSAGCDRLDAKFKTNMSIGTRFSLQGQGDNVSNAISVTVGADYWAVIRGIYVGVEVSGTHANQTSKSMRTWIDSPVGSPSMIASMTETLQRKHGASVAAFVGKDINKTTLFYGGLGLGVSKFTYRAQTLGQHLKQEKYLMALQPTVGVKVKLSSRMLLDCRYGYAFHQGVKINNGRMTDARLLSGKITPRVSTVSVGLSVKI